MKTKNNNIKIEYIFLLFVCILSLLIYGCPKERKRTSQYLISEKRFFETTSDYAFDALKISSQEGLETFRNQCCDEDILMYLKSLTNLTFTSSFIYITKDSVLQEIDVVSGMDVRIARVKNTDESGLRIYIVIGDPFSVIKPTEY